MLKNVASSCLNRQNPSLSQILIEIITYPSHISNAYAMWHLECKHTDPSLYVLVHCADILVLSTSEDRKIHASDGICAQRN